MKKILVTGSSGFIGFHLCKFLLKNNYRVFGIDNMNSYYDLSLKDSRLQLLKKNKEFSLVYPKKRGFLDQEGYETNKESGIRIMPFFEEGLGGTEGFFIAYLHLKGKSN